MRSIPILFFIALFFNSCIPIRVAPTIKDYKITKGKKFKKGLSKRNFFIFEDPKDAFEFYDYVNTKFQLQGKNVHDNIPFLINGEQFFFAFYEVEIPNKTLNLFPAMLNVMINEALDNEEREEYIVADDIYRTDNWYIAIEVYSDHEKDCLKPEALSRADVLNYLRQIKNEYLTTHNYNETLFRD